jgi:hypothetical protein
MNEQQKTYVRKLQESGYLSQLRQFAMARCAPFFWSMQEPGKPPALLHNGTICYVRTGQRDIGITANHVYQGLPYSYLTEFVTMPSVEAQFGGSTIYPETRFIDATNPLDVATFSVPEVFVHAGYKSLHSPSGWPPMPLTKGEWVIYGGYPGTLREPGTGQIVWPFQSFIWRANDVTEQNIVLRPDFPNLVWPGHEEERINENLGGISGGPVFRVIEKLADEKRVYLELVGIIYQYQPAYDLLLARHIRHVLADGSLLPL